MDETKSKDKTDEMFNLDIEMPQDEKDENQDSNGEQNSTDDKSEDDSENSSSGTMIHNLMVIQKMIQKKKHLVNLLMIKNQKKKKM